MATIIDGTRLVAARLGAFGGLDAGGIATVRTGAASVRASSWLPLGLPVCGFAALLQHHAVSRSDVDLNAAFDLLHFVHLEWLGRGAIDHGTRGDFKSGAVTLAHDCRVYIRADGYNLLAARPIASAQ